MTYAVKAELKAKAKMPSTSSHSADDQLFSLDVNFSSVGNHLSWHMHLKQVVSEERAQQKSGC